MQKICLIVPCFNEASRLMPEEFLRYLSERPGVSLCFVDDGSVDDTGSVLGQMRSMAEGRVSVITLQKNEGKAEAVRTGMLECLKNRDIALLGYMDADLSTPLDEIDLLIDNLNNAPGILMAVGSRVKRLGSDIERSMLRHYPSRLFATLASIVLDLPVYDTQCGAKIFRYDIAMKIFGERFITRWLFDVEIFARIMKVLGRSSTLEAALEVPLRRWHNKKGSKLGLGHIVRVPLDLLRIYLSYR